MLRRSTIGIVALIATWLVAAAVGVGAQNLGGSPEGKALKNAVPSSPSSIANGQALYVKNCQFCHGAKGLGDGPLAPKDSKPANLTDAKWDRGSTDGEIFKVIMEGAGPDFKMKGVKGRVADNDVWHIVNYLRSIAAK